MSTFNQLLNQIVDYAGLFPPAGLDLNTVVQNYDRYRQGPANWMLARIIIPAARLSEFSAAATFRNGDSPWPISALVPGLDAPDEGFVKAIQAIVEFNESQENAVVDAIEVKCPQIDYVAKIVEQVPSSIRPFLELPHHLDPSELIATIKESGQAFAKIRTGGVTEDLIPPCDQVARFIHACGQQQVGFKATAGLHHPIRSEFSLTYEADSPRGTMHGFLNVFVASMFAFSGADQATIEGILKSTTIEDFVISENQIQYAGHAVSGSQIETLRKTKAISFGSCSFEEPVSDLRSLGFESKIQPAV